MKVAVDLARGIAALHRLGVAHRDIKLDNIILTADCGLKLIDLGVARLPRLDDFDEAETPGTASFMAPELFDGRAGDVRSDQFAYRVTLYRLFTGRYPYGESIPGSRPLFGPAVPPSRYRPDLPAWLDAAILRAVALKPGDRFDDIEELSHMFEGGAARAAPRRRSRPPPCPRVAGDRGHAADRPAWRWRPMAADASRPAPRSAPRPAW